MNDTPPATIARWVAFDTETTGTGPSARLVELAAVAFADDGTVCGNFEALVNPGHPIPPHITAIHGITDATVADKPNAATVLRSFAEWLPLGVTLLAHNAIFDCRIIGHECRRARLPEPAHPILDTCLLARSLGQTIDNSLQTLVQHYGLTLQGDAHRALPDADAVRQYFLRVRAEGDPQITPWPKLVSDPSQLPPHLGELPRWVESGAAIIFQYLNKQGKASRPTITPLGWSKRAQGVLVEGWCHWAKEDRSYWAEAMQEVSLISSADQSKSALEA